MQSRPKLGIRLGVVLAAVAAASLLAWAVFWIEVPAPDLPGESDGSTAASAPGELGSNFDALLARVVDERGLVDYQRLRREREDLDAFVHWVAIAELDSIGPSGSAPRLAFLLNAYNAWVLYSVLLDEPPLPVSDHKLRFFLRRRFLVGGKRTSLHGLEHRWIRAGFGEPRIHFALNCASYSCPPLLNRRYRADDLDRDLDAALHRTLDDPRYAAWTGDVLQVTSLFDWFAEDFAPNGEDYLRRARPDWPWSKRTSIQFIRWDWSLNSSAP